MLRQVGLLKRNWLLTGMRECGGCVRKFAQRSGVNRTQLYKLLQKHAPDEPRTSLPVSERKRRKAGGERRATGGNRAWRALDHPEERV